MKFEELIEQQLKWGAVKYKDSTEKESTDVLVGDFGTNWLLGTLGKYCHRYKNLGQEKELLKIGAYMFILFLKRGFHRDEHGMEEIINTTVDVKEKHFPDFLQRVEAYNQIKPNTPIEMETVYSILKHIANEPFFEVGAYWIYTIWNTVKGEWEKNFANVEVHKTDAG